MRRFLLVLAAVVTFAGCASWKQDVKTVLDFAEIACITAHADLQLPQAVATACNIDQSLTPLVEQVLNDFTQKREAYAKQKLAAAHCGP